MIESNQPISQRKWWRSKTHDLPESSQWQGWDFLPASQVMGSPSLAPRADSTARTGGKGLRLPVHCTLQIARARGDGGGGRNPSLPRQLGVERACPRQSPARLLPERTRLLEREMPGRWETGSSQPASGQGGNCKGFVWEVGETDVCESCRLSH